MNPVDYGHLCAVATAGQRDLRRCATSYPDLFPEPPSGQTLFSTISFAVAFSAPGLPADRLRTTNRAGLWSFVADSLIDTYTRSCAEAEEIARRCLDTAAGAEPSCDASRFLTDIRDDLAASPGFAALETRWHEELRGMLDAMLLERQWIATPPPLDEYLPTAARSIGFSFVLVSHWIATGDDFGHADEVITVTRQVEPVLRLINDLGTQQRDSMDGDPDALHLGMTRAQLIARLQHLMAGLDLGAIEQTHPALAVFLDRQVGFHLGYYRAEDLRAAG